MFSTFLYLLLHGLLATLRVGSGGSFPGPLSPAEEREYVARAAAGDREAQSELILRNLRLVAHVLKKYYVSPSEQDDLISIGTIGLIKAVRTYDGTKKTRLATYAGRCIENEILMYFRSRKRSQGEALLSDELGGDGDGDSALELGDTIDSGEEVLDRITGEETRRAVTAAMAAVLDDREREIVSLRYGIGGGEPKTQREIAAARGLSRSYISRIEKRALEKMRAFLGEDWR